MSLLGRDRTLLLEVACSHDSILSTTMCEETKREDAAVRCSLWNDYDLSTGDGVKRVLQRIELLQPRHVWMSPECGPYSIMQNINQRNETQREELARKRKYALKQYVGCCLLFTYCVQKGIHCTWEWSQSCQAWRLPLIHDLVQRHQPHFAIVRGCQVGLRSPEGKMISKGWKLMTTLPLLARRMSLPCRCPSGVEHVRCEGPLTAGTAFYTPMFARRVCRAILHGLESEEVASHAQGLGVLPEFFGLGTSCQCSLGSRHEAGLTCCHCEVPSVHNVLSGVEGNSDLAAVGEPVTRQSLFPSGMTQAQAERKLYLLHAATGHGSLRHLVAALRRQGASQAVLDLASRFQCSVCAERTRPIPRPMSSLEPQPPKWSTVACDFAQWTHPHSQETFQFLMVVDEGSRFRVGRVAATGRRSHVTAAQFLELFQECWGQYFGLPRTLRLDPDGSFRSHEVTEFCDRHQIFLDIIAGEAHWKLSACERAIQGTKEVMTALTTEEPELPTRAALAEACRVFNQRDLIRGYSPIQHALGRSPDACERYFPARMSSSPDLLVENGTGEHHRQVARMAAAEKAHAEWAASERLLRAQRSKDRPRRDYSPGDLVFMWRKQVSGQMGSKGGRFIGPARILAVEHRRAADGSTVSGGSVWCARGRRLLKCSMEQLRPASEREVILTELSGDHDPSWDFKRVSESLGGHEYEDISSDIPSAEEWRRAQDVSVEEQPRFRLREKGRAARLHESVGGTLT